MKNNTVKANINNVKDCVPSLLMQSLGNAGCNLFVTILSTRMLGAVLYPVNIGGGLVLTVLCGSLFFKKKDMQKYFGDCVRRSFYFDFKFIKNNFKEKLL